MTDLSHDLTFLDVKDLPVCRLCGEEVTTEKWLVDAPCPVKQANDETAPRDRTPSHGGGDR